MPPLILGSLVLTGALTAAGYFFDKTGEGANDAANGAVKLVVASGVTYFALKKTKVL